MLCKVPSGGRRGHGDRRGDGTRRGAVARGDVAAEEHLVNELPQWHQDSLLSHTSLGLAKVGSAYLDRDQPMTHALSQVAGICPQQYGRPVAGRASNHQWCLTRELDDGL